ncbi:thisbe isoform 2-T7 [Cochliomyia hominivorax]
MTNQLRLLFLFVVISGALCTVEDYVIMSQCAHNKAINLAAEGTVSVTDISQIQNITIVGRPDFVNNNFKIALYAKETQRYLCFNDHWKLVGMKELQDTCYFNEAIVHGYFVFRSVVDLQRRIGFTQKGRAVGPKKVVNDACYMFTKIPTDQFFHQHSHFPVPKSKSTTTTTTRIPKTEYNHSSNVGRGSGSGGGRSKTNRYKNSQRKDDLVTSNHSGHGSANGHGSGGGSGSGSGNGYKKFKKQRNGNKQQRRQQQQQQQQQQQFRGHSYNLSNPKNSTYLNSSRQNLVLSQHSHTNNHTNNKNNNSNNNKSNPPQNHQVRHHHNDPNKVARRQQHDQKQKHIKLRQRVRPSPAPSASNDTSVVTVATSTTTATLHKAINSLKPHTTQSSTYSDIKPTNVVPTLTMDNQSDSRNTMASSSVVVAKRKGRRRKGDKVHKKNLQRLTEQEQDQEHTNKDNSYSSTLSGPNYEEMPEEEFMTTSTDYAWMTNDIMLSSVKPTSASLPTWETWYPSSSTLKTDENTEYSSASSVTEMNNNDKHFSTTLASSSMTTDLTKNTLSAEQYRQQQTSVSLPTYELSTTLTENSIDETISPTVTTDLGMTTTNTSTYTQTDFWSTSLNDDNTEADMTSNGFTRPTFNTYATPQLQDTMPTLNTEQTTNWEDTNKNTNTLSTHKYRNEGNEESSTLDQNLTATEEDEEHDEKEEEKLKEVSSPSSDKVSDTTSPEEGSTSETTSSSDYDKTSEITAPTTSTLTNDCAYSTAFTHSGSENMTDCSKVATKTLASVANKHPQREISPTQQTIHHFKDSLRTETTTAQLTKTTTVTVPTSKLSLQPLKTIQSDTPLHYLQPIQNSVTLSHNEEFTSTPAFITTLHSTKSPEPPTTLTTRKTLRKSTQRLLATPFHQLTYVRNEAGDIDIDSIDNISIYPEILDNDNDEPLVRPSTSRLTMISGYLPTSATATLPESIRIAKIKINRERKRMLRIRNVGNYA